MELMFLRNKQHIRRTLLNYSICCVVFCSVMASAIVPTPTLFA